MATIEVLATKGKACPCLSLEAIEMGLLEGRSAVCYHAQSAGKQGVFAFFDRPYKRLLTAKSKVRVLVGELLFRPRNRPTQRVYAPGRAHPLSAFLR